MACKPYKALDVTKEQFLEELTKERGNVWKVRTNLGLPLNRYYDWYDGDEEFHAQVDKIRKDTIKWVENCMFEKIEQGDSGLMKFYLNCKGGYVQKTEVKADVNKIDIEETMKEMKETLSE